MSKEQCPQESWAAIPSAAGPSHVAGLREQGETLFPPHTPRAWLLSALERQTQWGL